MNRFWRRVERLERALPSPEVMPDEIVWVIGRSWNPRIPRGWNPTRNLTILDPWGTEEQRICCRPANAVLDAAEGPDTVVLTSGARHIGHILERKADSVTMSTGGTSQTFKRESVAMFLHDGVVANREAAEARAATDATPFPDDVETDE